MMDFPKYPKELIKSIAEEIDMGMICFLNADTLEIERVLGKSYNAFDAWLIHKRIYLLFYGL